MHHDNDVVSASLQEREGAFGTAMRSSWLGSLHNDMKDDNEWLHHFLWLLIGAKNVTGDVFNRIRPELMAEMLENA